MKHTPFYRDGKPMFREVKRELSPNGRMLWGSNVSGYGILSIKYPARRQYYGSRADARRAKVSDEIGQNGRIE